MSERHYCLAELTSSAKTLSLLRNQLPKCKEQYDKYSGTGLKKEVDSLADLQRIVKRMWDEFQNIIQFLLELGDLTAAETAKQLLSAAKKFDYLKADYTGLCAALESFEESLPTEEKNINTAKLAHLMNRVRMGFFPTDLKHVDIIRQSLVFPEKKVNLFDPCCGAGHALATLAQGNNTETYGIELDEERGEQAQERLDRVGFGSFFYSRVSNEAFHCLFLNPPYMSALSETGGSRRLEKAFLGDSMRYLMTGGVLFYIIPYYRLTADVCKALCDNFEQIQVYRFLESEFKKWNQILVAGVKCKRKDGLELADTLLNQVLYADRIPLISELPPGSYALPATEKKVDIFKGDKFNVPELAEQLSNSGTLKLLFSDSKLDRRERQPLLPLNVSQIGLIGGSGLMNGLIDCETPHVIKGRIVKEHKNHINDCGDTVEVREVTSNKMIFNVLTPGGFKSLS